MRHIAVARVGAKGWGELTDAEMEQKLARENTLCAVTTVCVSVKQQLSLAAHLAPPLALLGSGWPVSTASEADLNDATYWHASDTDYTEVW